MTASGTNSTEGGETTQIEKSFLEKSCLTGFTKKPYFEPIHQLGNHQIDLLLNYAPDSAIQTQSIPDFLINELGPIEENLDIPIRHITTVLDNTILFRWKYPTVLGYMSLRMLDEKSRTFREALHLENMLLNENYSNRSNKLSKLLNEDTETIEKFLKSPIEPFKALELLISQEIGLKDYLLASLLTLPVIPGLSLHGNYDNLQAYNSSKIRTNVITTMISVLEMFPETEKFVSGFLSWHTECEQTNVIFRTRFSMLVTDSLLLKCLNAVKGNPILS